MACTAHPGCIDRRTSEFIRTSETLLPLAFNCTVQWRLTGGERLPASAVCRGFAAWCSAGERLLAAKINCR